jgi:glycosyltransferase involved in cell wall biosynthesis
LNLIEAQRTLGHEVSFACDSYRKGDLIQRAESRGIEVNQGLWLSVKSGPVALLRDMLALKKIYKNNAVDVIHTHRSHDHTLAALAGNRKSKVRLVRTLHAERSLGNNRDWQLKRADGLITVADSFRQNILERKIIKPERIISIEGAVDTKKYFPTKADNPIRKELELPDDALVVGIVARMKADRHHAALVEAWREVLNKIPHAVLVIAGRGELEQRLRRQVADANLSDSIKFIGYRKDLPEVYRAFDLKVLLAPGNDGTCRAALEAMASGVAVLAAKRGALPEIIRHGQTGFLVAADDIDALKDGLVDLLSDRNGLKKMGSQARLETESRFVIEKQVKKIDDLYRQISTNIRC